MYGIVKDVLINNKSTTKLILLSFMNYRCIKLQLLKLNLRKQKRTLTNL